MIQTPFRNIPQTMGTQHPDNVAAPYWEQHGDGFVNIVEEVRECASTFIDIGCEEFMWDWEGKHVDEGVVEKLLTEYHAYFKKFPLGRDRFLTFRVPNIWQEHGRSLARAFMSILTSEEFARDIKLHTPPLFEIILPMTNSATELLWMQKTFTKLARVKHELFSDPKKSLDHIEIIPLIEGVDAMIDVQKLLETYRLHHRKIFGKKVRYMRPFLARSDPALISGMIPAVAGNLIALSEMYQWSARHHIPVFPQLGPGALPFRGHLRPDRIIDFCKTYPGVRTVTIQSSFRYDFPLNMVKHALRTLQKKLSITEPRILTAKEKYALQNVIRNCEKSYQQTVRGIGKTITAIAQAVPRRRERRLHVGLLGYGRNLGTQHLPRAIPFTAACYSLGVPPELIGSGRGLRACSRQDLSILEKSYITIKDDLRAAGRFLNKENLNFLAKKNSEWKFVQRDVAFLESYLGCPLGPQTSNDFIHRNWSSTLYFQLQEKKRDIAAMQQTIAASGMIRKSLG